MSAFLASVSGAHATKAKDVAEGRKDAALQKKAELQAQANQLSVRLKTLQDTALHQRSRAKALVAAKDAKRAQADSANAQGKLAEVDKEVATTTKEAAAAEAVQNKAKIAASAAPIAQARDKANDAATQQVTNILLQNLSALTH